MACRTPNISSDISALVSTQNDFAHSHAPNPDGAFEVDVALGSNKAAVQSLSSYEAARAPKLIAPLRSFRVKTRKVTWWAF